MPTISVFYGIRIRLFNKEHNPPHFHASYQGHRATYDFEGNRTEGEMPKKQDALIRAWALLHSDDLQVGWEMAQEGEVPHKIDPLR